MHKYMQPEGLWIKVIEMLQQNWAIIETNDITTSIVFFTDSGGIFDRIEYGSEEEARFALANNGFELYSKNPELSKFIGTPEFPHREVEHPSGKIYSSGRFWTR
jgi:hypothetical protein